MKTRLALLSIPAVAAVAAAAVVGFAPAPSGDVAAPAPTEMIAAGTLKGKVITKTGEPAERVPVRVFGQVIGGMPVDGDVELRKPTKEVRTDANGNFNMPGLAAARYRVEAGTRGGEEGYFRKTVGIKAGEVTEMEIKLR